MGFNRRKMEDQRRQAAEKEAASRRATDAQVLEAAERLIAAWNERQAKCHRDAAVTSLIPALWCRSCRPMRHLPSWCGYRERASRTRCTRSTDGW
jgi:hypothetical protein